MADAPQLFPEFYRKHGTLTVDALVEPTPVIIRKLPVNSTLHILGDEDSLTPDPQDPLMKGYSQRVIFHNVTEHVPEHDHGVKRVPPMAKEMVDFVQRNRSFKFEKEFKNLAVVPARQLSVINYAWLDRFYKYADNPGNEIIKFEDKIHAVVDTIKKINAASPRKHFIVFDTPTELVGLTILVTKSLLEPVQLRKYFRGTDERILRHMWLFIDPETRKHSAFGSFTTEELKDVNILYRSFGDKFLVLNLGYLYSWVIGNENLTLRRSVLTKRPYDVQRYFLRGMVALQTIAVMGEQEAQQQTEQMQQVTKSLGDEGDGSETTDAQEATQSGERFQDTAQVPVDDISEEAVRADWRGSRSDAAVAGDGSEKAGPTIDETSIERDLQELERLTEKRFKRIEEQEARLAKRKLYQVSGIASDATTGDEAQKTSSEKPEQKAETTEPEPSYSTDVPESPEEIIATLARRSDVKEVLLDKLNQRADSGRMTATVVRKRLDSIERVGKQKDPYGSDKTIAERAKIEPKDTEIDVRQATLSVPGTVIDKSMTESTTVAMKEKYNTSTIYKDILGAVQAVQKAGVIVENHTVKTVRSFTGDYDIHTVHLQPLDGNPSVVTFRVPRINADGIFVAKGNRYAMRSLMADVPIRKIGPNQVGLSSYYGKAFVNRASKVANSHLAYIVRRLNKATIEPDEHIRDINPGDVFDNYFEAPYIYSGLSQNFKSMKIGDYVFDLNHKGFRSKIDPKILSKVEKDGVRVIGYTSSKLLVTVNNEGDFFEVGNDFKPSFIGDIFDLLKLERAHAPIDFSEIKIYSKPVPVGVFLAYQIGIRRLVKLLKAKHRVVEGRKSKQLQPYEYVVQFRDVAYIFDSREQKNTLILAGFNEFAKEIRLYDADHFDSKDIYLRLLETKGMNAVYLNEINNLVDLFVDPITERVLAAMGEPTTFNELVIRASEMLLTYTHPESQDQDYQRVQGTDRFAGFIYRELVNSIRSYRNKNRTGRSKIDLPPFEVWSAITRDSSVKNAEDINPIQEMKISQEMITYSGAGGRTKESMTRQTRAYLPSNMGIVAGPSVDSSDVGINIFTSANPQFSSTDGLSKKDRTVTPSSLLTTSSLLAPYSTHDD